MRNVLLISGVLVVGLVAMELAVRALDLPVLRTDDRVLLLSEVPTRVGDGSLRFPAHRDVREILVAGDSVEYDVRFRTNDRGRVDHRDYPPSTRPAAPGRAIAIAGDSYAMGVEGGTPWIPALRDATGVTLYNLGLGAVGVAEFARILRDEAADLWFSEIAIVAISDDFSRPSFDILKTGETAFFCLTGETRETCLARPPIVQLVAPDIAPAEALARARAARDAMARAAAGADGLRGLVRRSHLAQLVKRVLLARGGSAAREAQVADNVAALRELSQAFPDRRRWFIHVPDRFETARGRYDRDLAEVITAAGFEYVPARVRCTFTVDAYYERDNHPTAEGYRALAACVDTVLALSPQGAAR